LSKHSKNICLVYTDGASRGNPGKSGIGIVIKNSSNETIHQIKKFFPELTNNQAEYKAFITALKYLCDKNIKKAKFYTDSQLLSNQINRKWKVKHPEIIKLFRDA
jgi:ribonuclease HI